ncbi:hypothetical protein [Anaerovirgula multivorans]|uniref:hypothetical protein n=1 Tax=Anaerovirgula multivorans TaxID=312168 RepID=UPI000B775B73|nr:hypothetical protein [Anaerovirgula multivorans]
MRQKYSYTEIANILKIFSAAVFDIYKQAFKKIIYGKECCSNEIISAEMNFTVFSWCISIKLYIIKLLV